LPVQFDVRLVAPGTFEVNNATVQAALSVDVTLRGTYDRPLLFGQGEVERGVVNFEGRRYTLTRGRLDFTNPTRIDPFFDIEAETNVRQPGQTYRVSLRAAGTRNSLNLEFSADPPLPEVDVIAMLFGDVRTSQDAELQALQNPDLSEQELLKARAARLIGSPLFSEVGRVVEQTFGVDTFQITPLVGADPLQQSSRFNPAARLTIGKQISDSVYLTYARSLNTSTRDQIVLLEFDQSDRLSWIFTRNEDETYSLDFRVRHAF
jgi:autotransporter translocation and assembly factor TamB